MSNIDLTLVLMTCGEETEKECLKSIEPFINEVKFFEVRNVFPQIKALNQMIEQVQTEFFIPLDADFILDKDAWSRIKNAINKNAHDKNWHSILFKLWDTLTQKEILALKILRTKIMKENPFVESATPDVEHYKRLTSLGHTCIHDYLKLRPIGKHVIKGKHFCYFKFRDVYQTYRLNGFEWDSGVFMGGFDLRSKAKAHFDFFMWMYIKTNNEDYLNCISGMMDGILSPLENKSKTLQKKEYKIETNMALETFLNWYMEPILKPNHISMLF
jgi:hypothetical protein